MTWADLLARAQARIMPLNVPCARCQHLRRDPEACHGVRCSQGNASDMYGDFSCYEPKVKSGR